MERWRVVERKMRRRLAGAAGVVTVAIVLGGCAGREPTLVAPPSSPTPGLPEAPPTTCPLTTTTPAVPGVPPAPAGLIHPVRAGGGTGGGKSSGKSGSSSGGKSGGGAVSKHRPLAGSAGGDAGDDGSGSSPTGRRSPAPTNRSTPPTSNRRPC